MIGLFSLIGKLVVLGFLGPAIGGVIDAFLQIEMIPAVAVGYVIALVPILYFG